MVKIKMSKTLLFMCFCLSLTPAFSTSRSDFGDKKTYYPSPADPSHGTPPSGSTPYHRSPPLNCGTPPTHHHGSPPTHSTPSSPSSGHSPSTPIIVSPPSTPTDPGSGYTYPPPTYSGGGGSPPVVPVTPSTPIPTVNPPPFIPVDPNTPITGGTCDFWKSHIPMIWGLIGGWWTSIGGALGMPISHSSTAAFGPHMNLVEALSNTRNDGIGALYREGAASLLNSVVNHRFQYSTQQVKDGFVSGLSSNKAAAHHARLFKMANEGLIKHLA